MRNPQGYATIIHPGTGLEEHDTITCIHCGDISMTKSSFSGIPEVMVYRADGTHYLRECDFCRNCMAYYCPKCIGKPCRNRFKHLDQIEAAARKQFLCS